MFVRGKLSIRDGLFIGINSGTITCIRTCQIVNSGVLDLESFFERLDLESCSLRVCLDRTYFTETENLLLKSL